VLPVTHTTQGEVIHDKSIEYPVIGRHRQAA
jgi:hypothetical protein